MTETNKPLNLQYVSDVIGKDYKKWNYGDVCCIFSQTGTGKTLFITGDSVREGLIDRLDEGERLIYLCNRTALKRQVKISLLKKYNQPVPIIADEKGIPILDNDGKLNVDFDALDQITVIENVTVASYHAIASGVKDNTFLDMDVKHTLDHYRYIVCDECHFMFTDSGYMNKTNLVFQEIIRGGYPQSIVIYISATMDDILPTIEKAFEDSIVKTIWGYGKNALHKYTTGIDYSYLNIKYFNSNMDLVRLIANDTSSDKWLVFVTSMNMGDKIQDELKSYDINSVFIKSGTVNDETKSIIDSEKFNCKVLISTKVLDNGVNIKDESVKNLVVCAYDKTTFIQEIGRLRVNIKNPRNINLFIKTMDKKMFYGRIGKVYQPRLDVIQLFGEDIDKFKHTYNMDLNNIYPELFYLDKNNEWSLNVTGYARLLKDNDFACQMAEAFNVDEFAFIKEQLKWLERDNEFNEENFIQNVPDDEDVTLLAEFLENASNIERYDKEAFIESVMKIISKSITLKSTLNKVDGKHKSRSKGIKIFNKLFELCNLPYAIIGKNTLL